jgi:hypothetical protein
VDGINLIVASPLKAVPRPNRKIVLTTKFVDGLALYRDFWSGPITLACEPAERVSDNLDNIEIKTERLYREVDESLGWKELFLDDPQLVQVPGTHEQLGEHNLGLAKRMREVMERDDQCPP